MGTLTRIATRLLTIVLLTALVSLALLTGCSASEPKKTTKADANIPPAIAVPPPPMLRDPRGAVYSYMVWISHAYRTLNSGPAFELHAFSNFEEVRVNSYVELNRERGQAIDQTITAFEVKSIKTKDNTATVSVVEGWRYRYIDLKTGRYKGKWNEVTYDSTYTVVRNKEYGWQVDKVKATPRGSVK